MDKASQKNTCQELARKLGIGKATVSRAIRNCPGVDSETRRRILLEAMRSGIEFPNDPCSIYCILPGTPQFFWKLVLQLIQEQLDGTKIAVKYNVYTNLYDFDTVLLYLDEAERLGAKVLVLSAKLSPAIREKLISMQKNGVFVILLSEYGELPNSVYVGPNPYGDGERLGRWFCRNYPNHTPVILNFDDCANAAPRIRGFLHGFEQLRPTYRQQISMLTMTEAEIKNPKIFPGRLASIFSTLNMESTCIYTPYGSMQLPLVIIKSGLKAQPPILLAHDCFQGSDTETVYAGYTASCNQDLAGQVCLAMEIARTALLDPTQPTKQVFHYVPSRICCGEP